MHFYFLSFFFCLGTDIITESWSGSGRITEVTSTTELIDARGTLSTIEENKNESSVREVVSEPNYLPSTPATERSELVDYNLIDSDLFEKALPDKNEDSQSIIQVRKLLLLTIIKFNKMKIYIKDKLSINLYIHEF